MNSTAKEGLECPLQNHKVSFRLVDEHGDGRPFAGLRYLLHDRHDQTLEGNLDGEGFALIASTHCAPLVLDLSDKLSRYADPWYEEGCAGPGFRLACAGRQPRGRAPGGSRRRAETGLRLTPERASKPGRTTTSSRRTPPVRLRLDFFFSHVFRQALAIDLAAGRSRQVVEQHDLRRNHIGRQLLQQRPANANPREFSARHRHHVGDQPGLFAAAEQPHRRITHAGNCP